MSKNKNILILSAYIIFLIILIYLIFFNKSFLSNIIQFKISNLKENDNQIQLLNKTFNNNKDIIKTKEKRIKELESKIDYEKICITNKVDIPSILIYIENRTLLNNVYLEKINYSENKEKLNMQYKHKIVSFKIHGTYTNTEKFIKDINENIGKINYISNIEIQRGNQKSINMNKEYNLITNIKLTFNYY